MKTIETFINDLLIIEPVVFEDARGYFFESYNKELFEKNGVYAEFIQDNQSLSNKGVLRGMHFQRPPFDQGKLVRVIKGAVMDVALDIRTKSPTYGKHFKIELNEHNKTMLWIPSGFAHGFQTLRDNTIFSYKCTNVYNKESEGTILWNDETLAIKWQTDVPPILSEKDIAGLEFNNFNSPF